MPALGVDKPQTDDVLSFVRCCHNRKYFIETIESPEIRKENLCICVIDVNGLKETNDTLGHAAGDELICAVPCFAKKAFGEAAVISRMGGDEFAVLTHGSREELAGKVRQMKKIAAGHHGDLVQAVYLSAGLACQADDPELTAEGLYRKADQIMYEDKTAFYRQKGKDRRKR